MHRGIAGWSSSDFGDGSWAYQGKAGYPQGRHQQGTWRRARMSAPQLHQLVGPWSSSPSACLCGNAHSAPGSQSAAADAAEPRQWRHNLPQTQIPIIVLGRQAGMKVYVQTCCSCPCPWLSWLANPPGLWFLDFWSFTFSLPAAPCGWSCVEGPHA